MKFNSYWPLLALPVAAVIAAVPYLHTTAAPQATAQEQAAQNAQPQTFDNQNAPSTAQSDTQGSTQDGTITQNGLGSMLNDLQSSFFNDQHWNPSQNDTANVPDGYTQSPYSQSPYAQSRSRQSTQSSTASAALRKIYDTAIRSAVRVNVGDSGIGSGFFFSEDGLILTAAHVALGAPGAKLTVDTQDGRTLPVTLVGYDEVRDVAVLKAQGSNFPALKLAAVTPRVGAGVVAIGNSRGAFDGGRAGAVTALNVSLDPTFPVNLVESSMPLAPGDSGGPVLNADGEVVGISTAISNQGGQFASYFVPLTQGSTLVSQLAGGVKRGVPVLGIGVADARQVSNQSGVLVTAVQPNLGAAKAGLRGGSVREFRDASGNVQQDVSGADIIVGVDGRAVSTPTALVTYLRTKQAGDTVTLKIRRGTQTLNVPVKLSPKPAAQG